MPNSEKQPGVALGIDFRNTTAVANRELKQLDEIDPEVAALVLNENEPRFVFPALSDLEGDVRTRVIA